MAKTNENELLRLVRKAAGTFEKDHVRYFMGEVLPFSNDDIKYKTCTVKEISGRAVSKIDLFGPDSSGNAVDEPTQKKYNDSINQDLIHYDVALMPNVSSGKFISPAVGSQVVVLYCDKQTALVIQYGTIGSSNTTYIDTADDNVISNISSNIPASSVTSISDSTNKTNSSTDIDLSYVMHGYTRGLGDTTEYKATHKIDTSGHTLNVKDMSGSANIIQNSTKIDLSVENGAEIDITTTIGIKNSASSLNTILNDIVSYIVTINTALSIDNPQVAQTILDINALFSI